MVLGRALVVGIFEPGLGFTRDADPWLGFGLDPELRLGFGLYGVCPALLSPLTGALIGGGGVVLLPRPFFSSFSTLIATFIKSS